MKKQNKSKENKKSDLSKWPIPAFLFIGIGIGIILEQVAAFTLIGLGVGILVTYLIIRMKK
ncbi:hypothetical protein GOV12_03490 [Candidatus Pacearchaeota archaeon]|nr:hypothetical protein [Candidatus Pacearchaeota archaeon]